MYRRKGENNAQKARSDREFHDSGATTSRETGFETTTYSDGSSRVYFGGPCGYDEYDENGEEC